MNAHSIIHKVREIILFRWSENFSTQVSNSPFSGNANCSMADRRRGAIPLTCQSIDFGGEP